MTLALVLAACSATGGDAISTTDGVTVTTADPVAGSQPGDVGSSTTETTEAVETTETTSGRPLAPDFTLELGDGGTYTLSEGAKPVYLVFWAEW